MKHKQIEEYEVNPYTMFIKPSVYGSKIYSQIFEVEDVFLSPFKPLDIIRKSCEYFGSDYEGRKNGTRQLMGITHKSPIAIDPTNRIFFFPTTSPNRQECIWISNEHIDTYERISPQETLITFHNKQSFPFPVPFSSINNQVLRTSHFVKKLMHRIEYHERKSFYLFPRQMSVEASETASKYGRKNIPTK
ncbi:competence protein ComK [Neobacillus sp. K501]